MEIELLGWVTMLFGFIGWFVGPRFTIPLFFISTLLGASSAITLSSLGYATIQPAYFLIGFIAAAAFMTRSSAELIHRIFSFRRAGFWLLLTATYAALSAFFLPRLFEGATYVFAIARIETGFGIIETPLAPVSGNITQTVYFLGDLVCFLVAYIYACRRGEFTAIVHAALACACINILFGVVDLITYSTGTAEMLSFIRNGNYSMLDTGEVSGFKRIVGSFPEASTFAYFSLGLFGFCASLWLAGLYKWLTGIISAALLFMLIFSTSSTGYIGLAGTVLLFLFSNLGKILSRSATRQTLFSFVFVPLLSAALVVGLRLYEPAWHTVEEIYDGAIVNKLGSSSGIERSNWNRQALINFEDTRGLGAGNGSVRASSFPIAVLSNIGAVGAFTYTWFLWSVLFGRKERWVGAYPATCQNAARWACISQLIAASVSGSFLDLGLPFFLFAGLASAGPFVSGAEQNHDAPR